jgi:hypothetical protein
LNTANKVFKESWKPLVENLAKPTEYLLMSGGDLRLNIDEIDLLNKYGCRPFPDLMLLPLPHQLGQVFLTLHMIKQIRSILTEIA